jgi:hypothetical protein
MYGNNVTAISNKARTTVNTRATDDATRSVRRAQREAGSRTETPTRADVLQQLAMIMDNLDIALYSTRWATYYRQVEHASPSKAAANDHGAARAHAQIVASVQAIARIAVPNDPYIDAELRTRTTKLRAARM